MIQALVLALALFIDSGDFFQRQVITQVAMVDCNQLIYVTDEYGNFQLDENSAFIYRWPHAFCAIQSTDYNEDDGVVEARVQMSIGCDNERERGDGTVYGLQEQEFTYRVRVEDGAVLFKAPIEISPLLIRAGTWTRDFHDPNCRVDGS